MQVNYLLSLGKKHIIIPQCQTQDPKSHSLSHRQDNLTRVICNILLLFIPPIWSLLMLMKTEKLGCYNLAHLA